MPADKREMFRTLPWPYPDGEFPPNLGAVVQKTVLYGELPPLEVTHWADGSWTVGDGINDPNLSGAVIATHIGHVAQNDASIRALATMPPGHIAIRSNAREPWQVVLHDDGED